MKQYQANRPGSSNSRPSIGIPELSKKSRVLQFSAQPFAGRYFSRIGLIRKSVYVFASHSHKEILDFIPKVASREMSTSLRGVPSGLDLSYVIFPRYLTTSATSSANSAMLTSSPTPIFRNSKPE